MDGAATTNPWLIALINMTIVFAVLGMLGMVIGLIKKVDPPERGIDFLPNHVILNIREGAAGRREPLDITSKK